MRRCCLLALFLLPLVLAAGAAGPSLADRIMPGWNREPSFPPGSVFWQENNVPNGPIVYRKVVQVPKPVRYVAGQARTPWYLSLYVDGRLVAETQASGGREMTGPIDVDLTPQLTPGRHVLALSASSHGVDLDLVAVYADGTQSRIRTDGTWRVKKHPPLTILESQAWMRSGAAASGWQPVRASGTVATVSETVAQSIAARGARARLQQDLKDARWRLEMLATKGIALRDWEPRGFGGRDRLEPWLAAAASSALRARPSGRAYVDRVDALVDCALVRDEAENLGQQARYYAAVDRKAAAQCRQLSAALRSALSRSRLSLAAGRWAEARRDLEAALVRVERGRVALRRLTGLPANELNQARFNKVGWFDCPEMMDSNLEDWGLRVNPAGSDWRIDLAGKWRFKLDPDNTGLQQAQHTFGYNIENQWPELQVPGAWESQGFQQNNPKAPGDNPYQKNIRSDGPYNGYAWYRKTIQVPAAWAGYDLELVAGVIDDWDWGYFNGEQVGVTGGNDEGWWTKLRVCKIPKRLVRYGQYNVIALRVYDCGANGGILQGPVELRCPGLKAAFEKRPKRRVAASTVYSSPLSPAALITTGERDLTLWGWDPRRSPGPRALLLPLKGRVAARPLSRSGVVYDAARDGRLAENWVCLWMDVKQNGEDLPIQLVLQAPPRQIRAKRGGFGTSEVTLSFDRGGRWVAAVRPVRTPTALGRSVPGPALAAFRFWSRAAMAYPVSFTEVPRRDPASRHRLRVTDLYTYRSLSDAWGTRPRKVALLPPLACYADLVRWPGFRRGPGVKPLGYSLGEWGPLLGVVDADRITYTVPIDALKRMGGLTDFAFGASDVGGPGNEVECRVIRDAGGNSWRPQSNDGTDRIRRTVERANRHGLNLTLNCDGDFGARPEAVEHYRRLAEWARDLPVDAISYDLINEPANMTPEVYNLQIRRITQAIRSVDKKHVIYVETPHSFSSIAQFINLEATGDPRTVYSFHDYDFRLPERWPNAERDIRNMLRQWIPAFRYSIRHNAPIHLGEFGGFHQTPNDPWTNRSTLSLMADYFRIFDQFGWHFHYYSNRGEMRVRPDGSVAGNLVHEALRRYSRGNTLNALHPTSGS